MYHRCIDCGRMKRPHVDWYSTDAGGLCGDCRSVRMYRAYYEHPREDH